VLDCSNFANGVYNCILKAESRVLDNKKLVILK
jgi:hypothetical protein